MGASRGAVKRKSRTEVSKVLKLNPKRLDVFEREGLFEYTDKSRRFVDAQNFERLRVAVELQKGLGVNLAGLDVILAMREKMTKMKEQMHSFLNTARRELKGQLLKDLSRLERSFQVGGRSRSK